MPTYADVTDLEGYLGGDYKKSRESAAKSARKAAEAEAERAYGSTVAQLGAEERALRADQPIIEEGILGSIEREKLPVYQGKEESLSELGRTERDLRESTRGAVSTAGRVFGELATAIPRYAGTSVAGAVGEILGRQTARDIGAAKKAEQTGLFDIGQERNKVVKFAAEKVGAIESYGQNLIRQSKQNFLNSIDKINTLRRVAEEDKKSLRLQALYKYQGDVQNIASEIQSQKYNLQQWAYQKNLDLKNAEEARQRSQSQQINLADYIKNLTGGGTTTTPKTYQAPAMTPRGGEGSVSSDGKWIYSGGNWVPTSFFSSANSSTAPTQSASSPIDDFLRRGS